MPPKGMMFWVSVAARQAREEAERKQVHIAAEIDRDQSVVANFEKGKTQPRELDRIIAGYATDLGISEQELWKRALVLWQNAAGDPLTEASEAASDLAGSRAAPGRKRQRPA